MTIVERKIKAGPCTYTRLLNSLHFLNSVFHLYKNLIQTAMITHVTVDTKCNDVCYTYQVFAEMKCVFINGSRKCYQ